MDALNIEIKARCRNQAVIRNILHDKEARYIGCDHQLDTYYYVPNGRLKLRQGNIENALIYYERPDIQGPKQSDVKLYKSESGDDLKDLLTASLGMQIVVDKIREIYFIDNVKFHLDKVEQLGDFVEIEAIDETGLQTIKELQHQCDHYLKLFEIKEEDLVSQSYSDLIKIVGKPTK